MPGVTADLHILYYFPAPWGGAEHRIYELFHMLRDRADVLVWSPCDVHDAVKRQVPVQVIDPDSGHYPRGGNLLIVGGFFPIGDWIAGSSFRRVLLLHNSPYHRKFNRTVRFLESRVPNEIELEFASEWLMREHGAKSGRRQISVVDLGRFTPAPERKADQFVVGRHSRDTKEKHHLASLNTYKRLAKDGIEIKILGGTILSVRLKPNPLISLLPVNSVEPNKFLKQIDCFYYRTSYSFPEAHSRSVTEAMLSGIPVVAHRRGGYVDFIEHGKSGFLYATEGAAYRYVRALKEDRSLARELGRQGRERILEVLGPSAKEELAEHLLRHGPESPANQR